MKHYPMRTRAQKNGLKAPRQRLQQKAIARVFASDLNAECWRTALR